MKKKIIMLIPNLDFGGAQRVFHDHARVLSEKYEVTECVFNMTHGHAYPSGNRVVSLEVLAGKNLFDKIWQFARRCWKLYELKKQERPCMTISHLEGGDYVNVLSGGKGKRVLVVHGSKIHDKEMDSSFGWIRRKILLPLLYRQAHLIITVSEGIRYELIHEFGLQEKKIITIYNFFSLENLKAKADLIAVENKHMHKKKYQLITSGRLVNQKNQMPLLYIVKCLKDKQLDVQLYFAGDGSLKQDIIKESQNLGLSITICDDPQKAKDYDIVLLGYQDNPFQYYKNMDLFVFPSAWEGFPMALGEAMALGLPVVSSDCPTGPLELLYPCWQQSKTINEYPLFTPYGVLLPIPDQSKAEIIYQWSDTIQRLLENTKLRQSLGQAASKRMEALDQEVMKQKWLRIDEMVI